MYFLWESGTKEKYIQVLVGNPQVIGEVGRLDIGERIILVLEWMVSRLRSCIQDSSGSEQGQMTGVYEHTNEFPDHVTDQL
jgi:hypothetical protein